MIDLDDIDGFRGEKAGAFAARLRGDGAGLDRAVFGGRSVWMATGHDVVRRIYQDAANFSSEGGMTLESAVTDHVTGAGRMMIIADPPAHHTARSAVQRVTGRAAADALAPVVADIVSDLVDPLVSGWTYDAVARLTAPLPLLVACDLIGIDRSQAPRISELTDLVLGRDDPDEPAGSRVPPSTIAQIELLDILGRLVRSGSAGPVTRRRLADTGLPTDDVVLNVFNVLIGGHVTTRHAATGGLLALTRDPAAWDGLRASDRAGTAAFVEEVLRLTCPAMHVVRTVRHPVRLSGHDLRPGELVVLWNLAGSRDPAAYDRPDDIVPDRAAPGHHAFGHGLHYCVGAAVSRLELAALFRALADRFASVELAGTPTFWPSRFMNGISALPVRFVAP